MTIAYGSLIENDRVIQDPINTRVIRTILLDEVSGPIKGRSFFALQDPKVPPFNAPHEHVPDVVVVGREATAIDKDKVKITVTWSLRDVALTQGFSRSTGGESGEISYSAAVAQVPTNFDADGSPLAVDFTGTVLDSDGNETRVENDTQVATVDVMRPHQIIQLRRRELERPQEVQDTFVGAVNRRTVGGHRARTILCTGITATSDDSERSFEVIYEFQKNPDTWDAVVTYIDSETDRPPVDARRGNGVRTYRVYPERNFGSLRLRW